MPWPVSGDGNCHLLSANIGFQAVLNDPRSNPSPALRQDT
jgi:hypothetical protein